MVKRSKKSKSKRVSLRKKYKIIKKVKEHHKKKAKEAKKLGHDRKQKVEKDPGIPNDWPFKEQELKNLEARRAKVVEELEQKKLERKERAKKRKLLLLCTSDADISSTKEFDDARIEQGSTKVPRSHDHSERPFYKELVKVIEASDVILEVLDARDPLGTRCIDMEKLVLKTDPNKRLVLLLNKIDLVPQEAVEKWLKYFREELPTIAFKCSTQQQRSNLGWKSKSKATDMQQRRSNSKAVRSSDILQTSDCLGAETLIKLLKNYSRSCELKMSISVGVIGLPNVGKSSLINSLKRSHVVNVGATPGLTRSMQEVQLDKKVKLIDCPGVVMLKSDENNASVALRNCKRIEKLNDPISPVKEILRLCSTERLMSIYKLPTFSSVDNFLQQLATVRGKLKKGGIVDVEAAARIVLHDWNEGKIPYFTLPPARSQAENSEVSIVSEFGKEFDVDEVYKTETSFIGSLAPMDDFCHVEVPPGSPLNMDEHMLEEEELQPKMASDEKEEAPEAKVGATGRQNDKLYSVEGILDPRTKRAEKKRRKAQKANKANEMDADYDFKVDYRRKDSDANMDGCESDVGDESDGNGDEGDAHRAEPMAGVELDS